MIVAGVFSIIFCIGIMAVGPVFAQRTAFQGINEGNFKRVKIRRLKFMFRANGGQSVEKHGIIQPMLFVQIFGYVIALLAVVATPILLILLDSENNWRTTCLVLFATLGIEMFVVVCVDIVTSIVSKVRDKKNETTGVPNEKEIIEAMKAIKEKKKNKK